MAIALPAIPARAAIIIGPVAPPSCTPNLNIVSVTYLGKTGGKDSVQVIFDANTPSHCLGYGIATSASSLQFQGGQPFGYGVTVTIKRKHGNQDSGTASGSGVFLGRITAVVRIPRDTLETDPVVVRRNHQHNVRRPRAYHGQGCGQWSAIRSLAPVERNQEQLFISAIARRLLFRSPM